ncbi:alpha/beta hydrolase [Mycolicibacterium rufum]|uniref:Alpha/beta hydrolase n=1 Tax=Mycolicibacterium rufum TaxID=318424 RepID=A0A9X2Y911_9MYCO|nr:alpha/beta hydrolase [Mycolicibacterium rufum]MCV7069494.1 alpha/beta hydrolase [Mycolicibacterium rufum]ULP34633.1 alpha/beta hydrolase [Mycolicibacterium rufum]
MRYADTDTLRIAYLEDGGADGWPVVLCHGFPYDVHAFDEVTPELIREGARVIRPYARGFGPTRFLTSDAARSGEQAALADDLRQLIVALDLVGPIVAGYDWGGLACCGVAAVWPDLVSGMVSMAGYDVIDERQQHGLPPSVEHVAWYQHLFQTSRGRESLAAHRRDLCVMLWRQWSPTWRFDDHVYEATASSFDNPDFVDVVVQAYRHNFGTVDGDPRYASARATLARRPVIPVPTVTLDGVHDPLKPGGTADHAPMFSGRHEHRAVDSGHNLPQECPADFADAVLTVAGWLGLTTRSRPPIGPGCH